MRVYDSIFGRIRWRWKAAICLDLWRDGNAPGQRVYGNADVVWFVLDVSLCSQEIVEIGDGMLQPFIERHDRRPVESFAGE